MIDLETHKALVEVRAAKPGVCAKSTVPPATGAPWARPWPCSSTILTKPCPKPTTAWPPLAVEFEMT